MIIAAVNFPKPTPGRAFADISLLATPYEVGTKVCSFRADLSDLPLGVKADLESIQKSDNAWFYYFHMSGLPNEVTKRWFGIRSEEGNLFERKVPSIGRIAESLNSGKYSVGAPTQPTDNPGRTFSLYVCRTWKVTFPAVYVRPRGWRSD